MARAQILSDYKKRFFFFCYLRDGQECFKLLFMFFASLMVFSMQQKVLVGFLFPTFLWELFFAISLAKAVLIDVSWMNLSWRGVHSWKEENKNALLM